MSCRGNTEFVFFRGEETFGDTIVNGEGSDVESIFSLGLEIFGNCGVDGRRGNMEFILLEGGKFR